MEKMSDIIGKTGRNVHIYQNVQIGRNVTIGENTIIFENVEIGDYCFIGPNCILGEPLADFYHDENYKNPALKIGKNSLIRSNTILYAGSNIGEAFETGHRVTIRENSQIGEHCRVGTLSDIQGYVSIGNYCRFHSNVHICQNSTVKNYVWIYPYVVLTNDPHPPSDCIIGSTIDEYAVIATGSTIIPGITIGRESLVGAQSLVNKDVPPYMVVGGVPAKILCSVNEIKCKEGKLDKCYPWRDHYSKGYPWEQKKPKIEENK